MMQNCQNVMMLSSQLLEYKGNVPEPEPSTDFGYELSDKQYEEWKNCKRENRNMKLFITRQKSDIAMKYKTVFQFQFLTLELNFRST